MQNIVKEKQIDEIVEYLGINGEEEAMLREEANMFPVRVPEYYLNLIDKDDPNDPIRKLCLPCGEMTLTDGFLDTSGEHHNTVLPGVQHKYAETALVLCSGECAMYCRHCFRRRLAGKDTDEITENVNAVADYVRSRPEITNVLLSGGDALMLPTTKIAEWLDKLSSVPTLDFIRIGTRTPVSLPRRILGDEKLMDVLADACKRKQIYVVTHFNHPNEVTAEAISAVRKLQQAGVVVKNQTVLLRGINDDAAVLGALLRKMTEHGVVQHYIFQCRPVKGVSNRFQVPLREGRKIVDDALTMQNGLGKSADYTMSHVTGKIAILGEYDGKMLFKYRQCPDMTKLSKIFALDVDENQAWLPDALL